MRQGLKEYATEILLAAICLAFVAQYYAERSQATQAITRRVYSAGKLVSEITASNGVFITFTAETNWTSRGMEFRQVTKTNVIK